MANRMDKVPTLKLMVPFTKVNGVKINLTALVLRHKLTEADMKASISTETSMDLAIGTEVTALYTKENLKTISFMVKELSVAPKSKFTKVSLSKAKCKDKVTLITEMEESMRVIFNQILEVDMELWIGLMVEDTWALGKKAKTMEKE